MLYEDIVSCSFKELREKFPQFNSCSNGRKSIALKNIQELNTIGENSDILVYYDIVDSTEPLLITERLDETEIGSESDLQSIIDKFNAESVDYVATLSKVDGKAYFDVNVVKKNIYESVVAGEADD